MNCLNCGKELSNRQTKYCCNSCQKEFEYKQYIQRWKNGEEDGMKGKTQISNHLKKYLFEKNNYQCQLCGWNMVNPYTNAIPLEVHHIDGDATNNSEDNLQLLCPNCHSLTNTYKGANKNSTRNR